ncbi:unnamed protein product [Urochloa humidicola]
MAASTVSSWVPPSLPEFDCYDDADASSLVLLDRRCYIADLPNATTAEGVTSSGLSIKVTFRPARPPLLSHFCVHCPGLDFRRVAPTVVATDADLVLLCVPIDPDRIVSGRYWDYFVYRPRTQLLDRLPNPHPRRLDDSATALLSREDGDWYAVAALGVRPPVYDGDELIRWEFDLHLYRSSSNAEGWITKRLSVHEFERDKRIPLPDAVAGNLYHETGKTITVGGEHGTIAWVDLWRGIFLCDVLKDSPVLQDVPLPVPARSNWDCLLEQCDPRYFRDVNVSQNKDSIKYVEMEFWSPSDTTPDSYTEWVCSTSRKSIVTRDGWKSTTWSMAIPMIGSYEDWHRDCEVDIKDITLDDASSSCHSNLLSMLGCSKTTQTLKELPMAYPTISMDGNVVYLLSRISFEHGKLEMAFAIDMRKGRLQGLAELDAQKDFIFMPISTSEICRYTRNMDITGTSKSHGTEK